MKYIKYFFHVVRHKWWVFWHCAYDYGLWYQGLVHDLSKFSPAEFAPYAERYYGNKLDTEAYQNAWLHHWSNNPHHWQYWGGSRIPIHYLQEMISDYRAMAKTRGTVESAWWQRNRDKINIHPEARLWIDKEFGLPD